MIYTFILLDKPGAAELRQRVRPEHKAYLAAQAWLAGEPFTRAGLYASTSIHAFVNLWPQKAGFAP